VAVKVKIVVAVRFTVVGSTTVALTSDDAGSQLYVSPVPVTVAFNVVLVPYAMVWFIPASTTGSAFTVTVTAVLLELAHPDEVYASA
jgi:hypothetical protein